ncbi:MarR family winged helix-turn-helix transcriptional regulator [Marinomonas ostreistagni]|uniref:MarR family transcriptional regulator n=1 Tax=Marinomonas ostreistagni TaxID=359209 RepID=A0ABS0ZAV4_9GAMM|nr:MarR family transcriptional regulator [Marinomonas ostreistagni]MBJ7550794.1 MarR family transcriptional regulator [Marinomonas ostreistagni]
MNNFERDIQTALIGIISGLKHAMRYAMSCSDIPLSPLYFIILKMIHDYPNCTPMLIAHRCGRDKGQVTRLVKELEAQAMVERLPNPEDKRSFFLQLTEQGKACFGTLERYDIDALEAMTQGLTDEQLQHFLDIANIMSENLSQYQKSSP